MSLREPQSTFEQEVAKKRTRLAQLEAPMLRALEYQKSDEYKAESLQVLQKIARVVSSGTMNRDQALMTIGRIQQMLDDWKAPEAIIAEYDSIRATLNRT